MTPEEPDNQFPSSPPTRLFRTERTPRLHTYALIVALGSYTFIDDPGDTELFSLDLDLVAKVTAVAYLADVYMPGRHLLSADIVRCDFLPPTRRV